MRTIEKLHPNAQGEVAQCVDRDSYEGAWIRFPFTKELATGCSVS